MEHQPSKEKHTHTHTPKNKKNCVKSHLWNPSNSQEEERGEPTRTECGGNGDGQLVLELAACGYRREKSWKGERTVLRKVGVVF